MQMMIIGGTAVTLAVLAVGFFWRWRRFAHERAVFGTAIDRHWTNWWAGAIGGLGAGLVISLVAMVGHLSVPVAVGLWMSALTVLGLLTSGLGFAPAMLGLAGLAALLASEASVTWLQVPAAPRWAWHWLALIALLWGANAVMLRFLAPPIDVPAVHAGKRGAQIASYTRRQFYWLPLVLPLMGAGAGWTLAPLVLGVALTTRRQLPSTAVTAWAKQYAWSAGVAAALAGLTWWQPTLAAAGLGCLAAVSVALLGWHHRAAAAGHHFVSRTTSGVRLVAVQPDTPAAKMGLQAGDIVLLCNNVPVHSEAALYAALQAHPTYCRLKVQRLDGAIKLTETAIFNGAPHELGMITFTEDEHEEDLSR